MHDEFSSIENTSVLTNDVAKELENMKFALEACKIAVVDYKFDI